MAIWGRGRNDEKRRSRFFRRSDALQEWSTEEENTKKEDGNGLRVVPEE